MASLVIVLGGLGPGTYFFEDDGNPSNGIAQLRLPGGGLIPFDIPGPGELLTATATSGQSVVFNLAESFGGANILVGSLTDSTKNPDSIQVDQISTTGTVTLAANGAISEFATDAAPDIVALSLILSASSGIGTAGNALETQVGTLEAETTTGGIALANFGTVAIGGLTAEVDGLDVLTSGDLAFSNFGTIVLSDESGPETIHGGNSSGNVTLTANGVDSDIIANIDQNSIAAPRGSIVLTAGRDVAFGLIGANFDNDVRANGSITVNAGRDLLMDGRADMVSDDFGQSTGAGIIVNAGRNIALLAVAGTEAGLRATGTAGADILLTTGPGGTLTLNSGNGTALFASLISNSGDIIVQADRMAIGISGAISTPSGFVSLNTATAGRSINLGSATDVAFALELSDAELDRVFTPDLTLGGSSAGPITVSAAISPLNALNVIMRSGTNINVNASVTVGGSLSLQALDNVFQLAASTITAPTLTVFADVFDDDSGVGGIATFNGAFSVTTNVINGNVDNDTLNGNGAANTLFGFAGNDTLRGFGGADTLNGGSGFDTMVGGLGNDIFIVDNLSDSTDEAVGEGNDQVFTSISYNLGTGQEIEFLSTANQAGTAAINLTGNAFNQEIVGNNGANVFIGGGGADRLVGFGGNDVYSVDSADDSIQDDVGQGFDQVFTSSTFTLNAGAEIEFFSTLNQAGTAAINLTGNSFSQEIVGNNGVNVLVGGGGTDNMVGFGGNDVYFVDSFGDTVVEAIGAGSFDVVYTTVSYMLGAGQEIEGLAGTDPAATTGINLVGNAFGNLISGNAGANILDGKGGADVLEGGAGGDILAFTSPLGPGNSDTIVGFVSGVDKIALDDAVFGVLTPGALPAGAFRSGTSAQDTDDRIIYDPATGNLFYDPDGNGGAAATLFATLQGAPAITAGDFIVN